MFPPAVVNLQIYQGATFNEQFVWQTGNPATAVDLTGFTMRMQIRSKIKDPAIIIELNMTNGGIAIDDAVNGVFSLNISATQTASLSFNVGFYDIDVTAPDGITVYRLMGGQVSFSLEVTR